MCIYMYVHIAHTQTRTCALQGRKCALKTSILPLLVLSINIRKVIYRVEWRWASKHSLLYIDSFIFFFFSLPIKKELDFGTVRALVQAPHQHRKLSYIFSHKRVMGEDTSWDWGRKGNSWATKRGNQPSGFRVSILPFTLIFYESFSHVVHANWIEI